MKVKALKKFESVVDSTVNRVRKAGEEFEVDEKRVEVLLKANLIEVLEKAETKKAKAEEPEIKTAVVEEPKVKKAIKKSTKK